MKVFRLGAGARCWRSRVQTTLAHSAMGNRGLPSTSCSCSWCSSRCATGAVAGLLFGSLAGLCQDALSGGIIGVGGLAKSLVGARRGRARHRSSSSRTRCRGSSCSAAGTAGARGVLPRDLRADRPAAGSARRGPRSLPQALLNAVIGLIAFASVERAPGSVAPAPDAAHASADAGRGLEKARALNGVRLTYGRALADDRRSLPLPPLGAAVDRRRRLRRPRGGVLVPPGHPARRTTTSWPRTTTSGRSRCARRAACCSTATDDCWSRTVTRSTSRSCASRRTTFPATLQTLARRDGRRRGRAARRRAAPRARAALPARSS